MLTMLRKSLGEALQEETTALTPRNDSLFLTFIQKLPAAVAIFDKNLNYIITSDRWAEETHLNKDDIRGRNIYEVIPDMPTKWKKIHQRALNGEHLKSEEDVFNRSDGSQEWWRWEILPWYRLDGEIGGIILFVELISKRKRMEIEMKKMITALNHSNGELERFAHICAHDLNEPLRTIASYGQLLEADFKNELGPVACGHLNNITKSIKHMKALVDGILAYSQMDTAGLKKTHFSLNHLMKALLMVLEKKIKEKNAFIYCDKLPQIYADKALIGRVLQNLISNALKFNKSDIPIIYVTTKERKNSILFCVEDNGIGIEPKYQQQIFDLFKRLHHASEYSGTGVGLSLSKKIVEAHGGKMWVKSIPNEGSRFFFTLPKPTTLKDEVA
ncbi:MAG: PAS domain-containing protein [Proteobacteria bacterium]|nr:PAS domain-containing protein [Pseudomonadota bacterium]